MKNLFEYLEKKQKRRNSFEHSDEFQFYLNNRLILRKFPRFEFLLDKEVDDFSVMRANILIYSFMNKEALEKEIASLSKALVKDNQIDHIAYINTIKARLVDAPYYLYGKEKIYIPVFTAAMNDIYLHEPEKLLVPPYNNLVNEFKQILVDPFDVYGAKLFDSPFTRLINVGTDGKTIAYFHYDTNTIYFVNEQGRLDHKIVLFDRYIAHPNYNHMLERVKPVVEAYFNYSRSDLLVSLHENGLISSKVLSDILTRR